MPRSWKRPRPTPTARGRAAQLYRPGSAPPAEARLRIGDLVKWCVLCGTPIPMLSSDQCCERCKRSSGQRLYHY
jgi:hypothetical protein